MRYFCNITFVCTEPDTNRTLRYLHEVFLPAVQVHPVQACRLCRVHSTDAEAVSIALEACLPDFHSIKPWNDLHLAPALRDLSRCWGERLMYFITLLEELPLHMNN